MKGEIWSDARYLTALDGIPLHEQLRTILRDKMKRGLLQPGDMLPREIELALAYGVSRTTARRALLDLVQEGLLRRVPGKGTYVQQGRSTELRAIALICPFLQWYMTDLIEGIERAARSEGYELVVRNSQKRADVEARQIEEVTQMAVAGVILWPKTPEFAASPSQAVKELLSGPTPVVVVDQTAAGVDSVTADNFGGAYLLGQHLLQLGRTRIGFVVHHTRLPITLQARWEGLVEALHNVGGESAEALLFDGWSDRERFLTWFAKEHPDALFCANDFIALEVLGMLAQRGVSVPGDVAVVGFDDIPLAASIFPPLTTVWQDFRSIGQSAGRLLVDRIRTPSRPAKHITLPVQLRVRASCGTRVAEPSWA